MEKIRAGIVGMGYIGASHVEALRRIGFAELAAVADSDFELARRKADEFCIPRCCQTVDMLLADEEIRVVHNCTPNHLHAEINEKIIKAGKHVFSEKPLTRTLDEADRLCGLLQQKPNLVAGVNFNYRMNPLVQEIKSRISKGEIGTPWLVHGSYLQDWLLFETDYNWRIEPEVCGPSRCVADIGSHWMDTVQTVLGAKITEVCADLATVIPVRKKPVTQVETFSLNPDAVFEEKKIMTEDYGAVLFKMDNGVHGVFHVSEVSAGRGCFLNFEVDGSAAALYWNQENADQMWMGFRDQDNRLIMRDPNHMDLEARRGTCLAKGHPEGWNDAFKNNVASFYRYIAEGRRQDRDPCSFATFEEARTIIRLTEAILESSRTRSWITIGR